VAGSAHRVHLAAGLGRGSVAHGLEFFCPQAHAEASSGRAHTRSPGPPSADGIIGLGGPVAASDETVRNLDFLPAVKGLMGGRELPLTGTRPGDPVSFLAARLHDATALGT
jgi:hypothetical protein